MEQGRRYGGKALAFVVGGLVVLSSILAVVMVNRDTAPPIEESVKRALATDVRADGVVAHSVVVTKATDSFVRGTLVDERDGIEKTFFAMRIGDVWRIVEVTTQAVSCERYARLGFPDDFIVDCRLSFADAVTVAEIDATISAELLAGATLQVIGFVDAVNAIDSETQAVVLTSGGVSQTVAVTGGAPGVGSLVVVTIDALALETMQSTGTQGGTTATTPVQTIPVTSVVTVGANDTELISTGVTTSLLPQEHEQNTTHTGSPAPVTGAGGTTVYKINAPNTAPPPSFFFSAFDVDQSFETVQIDGSF